MDELKMIAGLLTEPPPAEEAVARGRARLTAAMSAPLAHPARRRSTVVALAAAAALAAAGAGYGLTAARGAPSLRSSGSRPLPATAAGLIAVHGCPGRYITAGTLSQVSGTQLIIQPANDHDHVHRAWRARPVTVATSATTVITRPVRGTVSDITDGSQVVVNGTWSGGRLAATQVGIEAGLPSPGSFGPRFQGHPGDLRTIGPPPGVAPGKASGKGFFGPPTVAGTVADAHDGSFAVIAQTLLPGAHRVQVITSRSTEILTRARASLGQLAPGINVVAVGQMGPHGVLTASTVAEPSATAIILAGGPAKIRSSGCSASAITTAAVLAGSGPASPGQP